MADAELLAALGTTGDVLVTLDFETYHDKAYKLRTMTTESYVRDPRFEVIGVGVKLGNRPTVWLEERQFRYWASRVDWSRVALCCHHAHFDAFILSHHYGIRPRFLLCTMSMARGLSVPGGVSLNNVSEHFGLGKKGEEVRKTAGKRRGDFTQAEWLAFGDYCVNDTELTYAALFRMLPLFPALELWTVDRTVRAFTEPIFEGDQKILGDTYAEEVRRKGEVLRAVAKLAGVQGEEAAREALASSDKFSAILRALGVTVPTKPGKRGMIPAFAQNDPGFKTLLESPDERVRQVCEARLDVKSTIVETRTERIIGVAKRGKVPFYLKYSGAHTHRWSGGDKMNPQNFNRGGALRDAILAPAGHLLAVADSSQIEARKTAWLAGATDLLATFRRNDQTKGDFYSDEGTRYFRKTVSKKETPGLRQVAKCMCLSGATPVLTELRGWVPIVNVTASDRVWDGVDWVTHSGVVNQGEQEVWTQYGITATPDHGILTEHGWREWQEVLTNPFLFQSALVSVALPSSDGTAFPDMAAITRSFGAIADGRGMFIERTSDALLSDVIVAPNSPPLRPDTNELRRSSQTMSRAIASRPGSMPASGAARTQPIGVSGIMGGAEFAFTPHGSMTGPHSSPTSSPWRAGTSPRENSIESTTVAGMSRAIFASRPSERICLIGETLPRSNAGSPPSKQRTQTYDLVSAGPRSRFTILTDAGPVIAHNCLGLGFKMGWLKFASELLKGMLNTPPVQFGPAEAREFQVNPKEFGAQPWGKQTCSDAVQDLIDTYGVRVAFDQLLIHCAVAEYFVRLYRKSNPKIVQLWGMMDRVLGIMARPGPADEVRFTFRGHHVIRNGIIKPSGLVLQYPQLTRKKDGWSYLGSEQGRPKWKRIHGGVLTENVVQSDARDVLAEQMLWISTRYRIGTTTHDEVVAVPPEQEAEQCLAFMLERMRIPPAWCHDMPLNAEGGIARSYGSAK